MILNISQKGEIRKQRCIDNMNLFYISFESYLCCTKGGFVCNKSFYKHVLSANANGGQSIVLKWDIYLQNDF
jgi:hypothetical protein